MPSAYADNSDPSKKVFFLDICTEIFEKWCVPDEISKTISPNDMKLSGIMQNIVGMKEIRKVSKGFIQKC